MHTRIAKVRSSLLAASLILSLGATACGDDNGSSADGGSRIEVALQEWAVLASPAEASGGEVTFEITNRGEETHEFVILKTDLNALDLPTAEDGSVDEEGGDMEVADEVEDIPSGSNEELTVELEAGSYILLCNIVEEEESGETESHFQEGMRTSFTVE